MGMAAKNEHKTGITLAKMCCKSNRAAMLAALRGDMNMYPKVVHVSFLCRFSFVIVAVVVVVVVTVTDVCLIRFFAVDCCSFLVTNFICELSELNACSRF